ncbi:EamA family transporter [Kiloniella majae]|uniref:EamA family transporter n=1 Tax=Kiloniella majae TaxID=1938558 RepID=UPI0021003132|nr:EamA family transporter [Kiloniella majae]
MEFRLCSVEKISMKFYILIVFTLIMSSGQMLFKKASLDIDWDQGIYGLINPWLITAIILYGAATLLWVWILRSVPLSFAYSFSALAFVIVPIAASFLFKENIGWQNIVGTIFIVMGIFIISLKEI